MLTVKKICMYCTCRMATARPGRTESYQIATGMKSSVSVEEEEKGKNRHSGGGGGTEN